MAECNDPKCAEHGSISVRGNVFRGRVISAKAGKTVLIQRELIRYIPKYERYKKIRSKIAAHNPPCISAVEGDLVTVGETRKLSKTKNFVVLNKIVETKAAEEKK